MQTWWTTFRAWPRPARIATGAFVALLVLAMVAAVVTVGAIRRPLPQTDGELAIPGLDAEVTVIRDGHGIPQIYADNTADLMRAQGFVAAQERFYEMDIRRHITAGRLSELFGEATLETDKVIRTMGWRRVAEEEFGLVSPDTREALEAYSEGVNAYLSQHSPSQISVEYTILGLTGADVSIEPWTPVDSLAWLKAMAWDLRGNMEEEIQRVLLSVDHDADEVAELYPPYPYAQHAPILDHGAVVDDVFDPDAEPGRTRNPVRPGWTPAQVAAFERAGDAASALPALIGRGDGIGSNSWVVSGDRSATGKPLLANDPHLGVSQPGIWLQAGLHCRTVGPECPYDVSGFTFAGVPGVIIGHNADIAWGFTNLSPDVTDLYLEKVQGTTWFRDGTYLPLELRDETIKVAGGEDFVMTVRSTRHGPLISDVSPELSTVGANAQVDDGPDRGNGYAVALSWTALQPSTTADAILGFNAADDWNSFRAAARQFAVPAQNLVYADRQGHIGYQAPGAVPIRKSGNDGRVPSEGWLPENDWADKTVPFDALPHELDPEQGFVATANQAVIGPDYRYHLTDDWDQGYRAERIRELLLDEGEMSVQDMADLQLDDHNALAEVLTPYLLDVDLPDGYDSDGQRLLADWDYSQPADSGAAAYFNVVWSRLLELTFHDDLRERTWPDGGDRWWSVVSALLRDPDSAWWDDSSTDDVVESRDDILRAAMLAARDDLTRLEALDPDDWTWGRLHRLNLHNQTLGESGVGPIEALLNVDGAMVGGGSSIVNATSWDATAGYEVTAAPSMRMVVSLADFDDSRWINLTGVSGHAGSEHYDDQTELFVDGKTLEWPYSPDAVEAAGEDTLTLVPAGE